MGIYDGQNQESQFWIPYLARYWILRMSRRRIERVDENHAEGSLQFRGGDPVYAHRATQPRHGCSDPGGDKDAAALEQHGIPVLQKQATWRV